MSVCLFVCVFVCEREREREKEHVRGNASIRVCKINVARSKN